MSPCANEHSWQNLCDITNHAVITGTAIIPILVILVNQNPHIKSNNIICNLYYFNEYYIAVYSNLYSHAIPGSQISMDEFLRRKIEHTLGDLKSKTNEFSHS